MVYSCVFLSNPWKKDGKTIEPFFNARLPFTDLLMNIQKENYNKTKSCSSTSQFPKTIFIKCQVESRFQGKSAYITKLVVNYDPSMWTIIFDNTIFMRWNKSRFRIHLIIQNARILAKVLPVKEDNIITIGSFAKTCQERISYIRGDHTELNAKSTWLELVYVFLKNIHMNATVPRFLLYIWFFSDFH